VWCAGVPAKHGRRVREGGQIFDTIESLVRELEQLASSLTSKKRKRDPGPIDQVLGDIIALTYADARALAEPSRMGALEL
jgi:hypothetical protein